MPRPMKIDFVSDISCPWCIIGLRGLEEALARIPDLVEARITFHPLELNPDMRPAGENIVEHVGHKYGTSPEQSAATRAMIQGRAAAVGFAINMSDQSRIYNTFDAHRLLHWAAQEGRQGALKHALFSAYFTEGQNPSDRAVLIAVAQKVGLDAAAARSMLESDLYTQEVREAEMLWQSRGITSVPAVIIDDRYLISGGQPPEAFELALRAIVAESD